MDSKGRKIALSFTFIFFFTALPLYVLAHALPGTYNYVTIHGHEISYRLIISGIDMCRLTHWNCEDLTEKDIGRLRQAHDEIQEKLNRGIQILQSGRSLRLNLDTINPLPFGFELSMSAHTPTPVDKLIIHYTLLSKENPSYQSFFNIETEKLKDKTKLFILNKDHSILEWQRGGPIVARSESPLRQHLFDLQSFVTRDLSAAWLFIGFVMAFLLGIGHAFTPGHGKSLMAAYLVGQHGHIKDAIVMGLTTTFTHTFSVILLGLIIMFFSHIILPSTLFPWVARISALLIIATGVYVLYARIMDKRAIKHHHGHDNPHNHDHAHSHSHSHTHTHPHTHPHPHTHHHHESHPERSHTWQAFWLSFSGGIIPCPSAMAVLFAAISIGKIGYGILMILVFSLGLGATLVAIGIAILTSRNFLARMERASSLFGHLDLVGPAFIIVIGILFLIHGPFGSVKI